MPSEDNKEFDAIWMSSLTDSTAKGKPDIELVNRYNTVKHVRKRFNNMQNLKERITYLEHELASKRHDGYTEEGLKKELKKLKEKLKECQK